MLIGDKGLDIYFLRSELILDYMQRNINRVEKTINFQLMISQLPSTLVEGS